MKLANYLIVFSLLSSFQLNASNFELTDFCNSDCAIEKFQLKKYAKKGSTLASFALAVMYLKGAGDEPNIDLGMNYLRKAYKNNEPAAVFQMAHFYHYGQFVEQDLDLAGRLYQKAKKLNVPNVDDHIMQLQKDLNLQITQQEISKQSELSIDVSQKFERQSTPKLPGVEVITIKHRVSYQQIIEAAKAQACDPRFSCPQPWKYVHTPLILFKHTS